jgi:hypothetical protein
MRNFAAHYRLYEILRKEKRQPTSEELDIIQGRKTMDKAKIKEYRDRLDNILHNIRDMLERQAASQRVR